MRPVSQAVVLVGGRGTRLGKLTKGTPKPMLPVGGRPFLEYLVEKLAISRFTQILFCTSYLGEVVRNHFGDGEKFGVCANYSQDSVPLGTGGALCLARAKLDEQFLVLNGDTLFDIPLRQLTEQLTTHPTAKAAMALRKVEDASRYGSVWADGEFVTKFDEKGVTGPGWINGGIYCLRREALDLLPAGKSSLEYDMFPFLVANRQVCAFDGNGYFIDIGVPPTLARARVELPLRFQFGKVGSIAS